MRRWRLVLAAVATAGLVWAMRTSPPPHPLHPIVEPDTDRKLGGDYDRGRNGVINGRVSWTGSIPKVPDIPMIQVPNPPGGKRAVPNPNAAVITRSGGVEEAVVWLEGIDLSRSSRWEQPEVLVEVTKEKLAVIQGASPFRIGIAMYPTGRPGSVGIVHRSFDAEFVSREAALHSVRGRGASFFTQMLTEPNRPVRRELPHSGVVELTSGSGYYWLRGYLFVSDHPYVAVAGFDGGFRFNQVPDGTYDIVCWKANWHIERTERNPEWLGPVRLFYWPPVEIRKRVTVVAGQVTELQFTLSEDLFRPPH